LDPWFWQHSLTFMMFPVCNRPGTVFFLDDEPAYLEMIADVLPSDWDLRLFCHPEVCLTAMKHQMVQSDADVWCHREILERWRGGHSLVSGVLHYWRRDGIRRYGLGRVWVVDYTMPAMNGLQAVQAARNVPVTTVLLTGRADEHIAIGGFNAGLIDQYIPKQANDIADRLVKLVEMELNKAPSVLAPIWHQSLNREQLKVLSDRTVAQALDDLVREQNWIEYVLIGQPFGLLALDGDGSAYWMQLEFSEGLGDLAELARLHGIEESLVMLVEAGSALFDIELRLSLAEIGGRIHPAGRLGVGASAPVYSVQALGNDLSPGFMSSLARYRDVRASRAIEHVPDNHSCLL